MFRPGSTGDSRGAHGRRTLVRSLRHDLLIRFARLVRGSSRRIMTVRFRPADIRVINRRICFLDYHPCCPTKHREERASPARSKTLLDRSLHIRTRIKHKPILRPPPWGETSAWTSATMTSLRMRLPPIRRHIPACPLTSKQTKSRARPGCLTSS
jgi:hypothetical protein